MESEKIIRVASRKSQLALIQTKYVIAKLKQKYPEKIFEIHTMSTVGDRVLNKSLPKIGEKSLFTRDLEDSLRNGGVDLIVHSLKDLPTALPDGMTIACVLRRENPSDVVVMRKGLACKALSELPERSVIGTSSLRRTAQLRRKYKNLKICDIRGNLNTRLAKLDAQNLEYAAIVLAKAGLERMGWKSRIDQELSAPDFLYAVGQGALAVECRANDEEVLGMLRSLVCLETTCCILAERSFLKTLGGGCSAPIGVHTCLNKVDEQKHMLDMHGAVFSLDGTECVADNIAWHVDVDVNLEATQENEALSVAENDSPVVINEEANPEKIAEIYDMKELLGKHMQMLDVHESELKNKTKCMRDCPLPIEVGQDFMGECPFVLGAMKTEGGECPFKKEITADGISKNGKNSNDDVDKAARSVSPFTRAKARQQNVSITNDSKAQGDAEAGSSLVAQCPFRKRHLSNEEDAKAQEDAAAAHVQMFDYNDEDKPLPSKRSKTSVEALNVSDFDYKLFCGLYGHTNFDLKAFERCCRLGMELAQNLISKGADRIIKCAQDAIHH